MNMERDLHHDLDELESAEDFLEYFGIDYDPQVVTVNRLHILQRFHDYLGRSSAAGSSFFAEQQECLARAYCDFVRSDAITEKVFRVHRRAAGIAFVPLSSIGRAGRE